MEVPVGRIRFCTLMALTTSLGASPRDWQRCEVDVDLDLALLAAVRERDRGALDGRELRANGVVAEVEELLLRDALAREGELEDRARSTRCSVMMRGGVVPGGSCRRIVWAIAVTCATAGLDLRAAAGRRP